MRYNDLVTTIISANNSRYFPYRQSGVIFRRKPGPCAVMAALCLTACQADDLDRVTAEDSEAFDGISESETVYFSGVEPFWGGKVANDMLTYSTPENGEGDRIAVRRFAGLNGLAFSGEWQGRSFDMTVTPGRCSDGMSDRIYPFTITLRIGEDLREGCGYSDDNPFSGTQAP